MKTDIIISFWFQLQQNDPVHTVNMRAFVSNHLTSLQQQLSQPTFEQLIKLIDVDVMSQLQRFIK